MELPVICGHCARVVNEDHKLGALKTAPPPEYMRVIRKKRSITSNIIDIQEHQRNVEQKKAMQAAAVAEKPGIKKRVTTYQVKRSRSRAIWIEICETCKAQWYQEYLLIQKDAGEQKVQLATIGKPCACCNNEYMRGPITACPVECEPSKPYQSNMRVSLFDKTAHVVEDECIIEHNPPTDEEKEDLAFINRHKEKVELDIKMDPDASW